MFLSVCVVSASVKTVLYFIPIKHDFHAKNSKKQNKMKLFPQKKKYKKNLTYKSASDPVIGLVGADSMGTHIAACLCGSVPVGPPVVSKPYWEGASFPWLVPYFSS